MESENKNRGGQVGNQNARKHGFYSNVLDDRQREEYENAILVEGLDAEIALMRVKIMSLIENDPHNIKLISQALNALERLIKTKYDIDKDDKHSIWTAVETVLKNVALPLGFTLGDFLMRR
jgi:hypothetical protein